MAKLQSRRFQRVQLAFLKAHSRLYQRLSLNVLREVSAYLDTRILPALNSSECKKLILHDLATETHDVVCLQTAVQSGLIYCSIGEFTLMFIGSGWHQRDVMQVDLCSGAMHAEPPMSEGRGCPGVICFDSHVFVFGGHSDSQTRKSCEAFSLSNTEWVRCPDMLSPKVAFTPVEHRKEIYLPAPQASIQQLEVFTPESQRFRLLPLRFEEERFGSVSFIYEGKLLVVTYSKTIFEWTLGSQVSSPRAIGELKFKYNGFSNGQPVRLGEFQYWSNCSGKLLKFSLKDKILYEP